MILFWNMIYGSSFRNTMQPVAAWSSFVNSNINTISFLNKNDSVYLQLQYINLKLNSGFGTSGSYITLKYLGN